jgi:hypothetical protein
MTPILPLIQVAAPILSSYDAKGLTGGPRSGLRPLATRASGVMIPGAAAALLALHDAVAAAGGDLRITDCHRSYAVQAAARAEYEAGKKPFCAEPGRSNHNGGRAVDIHVGMLRFPTVPADRQLDTLWSLMAPLGWSPVIDSPNEGASEAWHIEWRGELAHVYAKGGPGYADAALIGALLVGHAGRYAEGPAGEARLVQTLAHRAGANVGRVDGAVGRQTRAGVEALIQRPYPATHAEAIALLAALPTPGRYL